MQLYFPHGVLICLVTHKQELRQETFKEQQCDSFLSKRKGTKIYSMMLSQRRRNTEVAVGETDTWTAWTAACLLMGPFGTMEELSFNVDHGYLEGLVRGMKAGILTQTDYHNLAQCDTLEGENMVSHCHVWLLHRTTSCWMLDFSGAVSPIHLRRGTESSFQELDIHFWKDSKDGDQ